jgi:hypothetical protein
MASSRSRRKNSLGNYVSDIEQRIKRLEGPVNSPTGVLSGTIDEAQLAEEVTLQNTTIQSGDFVQGQSGWRITSHGDAEFSNVVVRGDINAQNGTIGQWHLSNVLVTRRGLGYSADPAFEPGADLTGTFIENIDQGDDDIDATTGQYIALFCSQDLTTAGLYLNDYADDLFSRAYFSSDGVFYAAATNVNLVYNPNFEIDFGATSTLINWSLLSSSGYSGPTAVDISGTVGGLTFAFASNYGSSITWTSAPASWSYYRANANFSVFKAKQFQEKNIYLSFELYPYFVPTAVTVTSVTANSTTIVVNTSGPHGYSQGDYIYFDFSAYDSADEPVDFAINYFSLGGLRTHEVTTVFNSTRFYVAKEAYDDPVGAITIAGESSATPRAYKTYNPIYDANDIRIVFGAGSPVTLGSLIATADYSNFINNDRYLLGLNGADTLVESYLSQPTVSIAPQEVYVIDGSKLNAAYIAQDPTGYAAGNDFYVDFPVYFYSGNLDNEVSNTKVTSSTAFGFIIDSVYLASGLQFFDGDSSQGLWGPDGNGDPADSVSYSIPKIWMNLDITYGDLSFENVSQMYFENQYSKSLVENPAIYTQDAVSYRQFFGDVISTSTLFLTGGTYITSVGGNADKTLRSGITSSVSSESSGVELYTERSTYDYDTDEYSEYAQASLYMWSEAGGYSYIEIVADDFSALDIAGSPILKSGYNYGTGTSPTNEYYVRWRDNTTDVEIPASPSGATSYSELSNVSSEQCRCRFIAPPSGIVSITISAELDTSVAGNIGRVSYELYNITTGTTLLSSGNDRWGVANGNTERIHASFTRIAGGLTPYDVHEVRVVARRGAGSGVITIYNRSITVIPIT